MVLQDLREPTPWPWRPPGDLQQSGDATAEPTRYRLGRDPAVRGGRRWLRLSGISGPRPRAWNRRPPSRGSVGSNPTPSRWWPQFGSVRAGLRPLASDGASRRPDVARISDAPREKSVARCVPPARA